MRTTPNLSPAPPPRPCCPSPPHVGSSICRHVGPPADRSSCDLHVRGAARTRRHDGARPGHRRQAHAADALGAGARIYPTRGRLPRRDDGHCQQARGRRPPRTRYAALHMGGAFQWVAPFGLQRTNCCTVAICFAPAGRPVLCAAHLCGRLRSFWCAAALRGRGAMGARWRRPSL